MDWELIQARGRFSTANFPIPQVVTRKGNRCVPSSGNVERAEAAGAESLGGISTCNTCAIPLYSPFPRRRPCYRSSMAEHWFCKPDVVGSTPTGSFPRGKYGVSGLRGRVGTLLQLLTRASVSDTRQQGSVRVVAGIYRRMTDYGQMAERPMAPDCKSGGLSLRRFESCSAHYQRLVSRGCSSMVEHLPSKQTTRVRFPSPALPRERTPCCCSSAVERFLGKDEVLGSNPSSSFWK
jgi:hypothetical protein